MYSMCFSESPDFSRILGKGSGSTSSSYIHHKYSSQCLHRVRGRSLIQTSAFRLLIGLGQHWPSVCRGICQSLDPSCILPRTSTWDLQDRWDLYDTRCAKTQDVCIIGLSSSLVQ